MHDLWNFSPPPAMSSSSSSDGNGDKDKDENESFKRKQVGVEETVVLLDDEDDTPARKKSEEEGKGKGKGSGEEGEEDEDFVLGLGSALSPSMKRQRKQTMRNSLEMQKLLSANARTMESLKDEEYESVDGFFDRLKNTAREEEEKRAAFRQQTSSLRGKHEDEEGLYLGDYNKTAGRSCETLAGKEGEGGDISSGKIVIVVKLSDGKQHEFRLSTKDKMSKVFNKMGEILGEGKKFVLSFDGDKLTEENTPEGLDMEDRDVIDLHVL